MGHYYDSENSTEGEGFEFTGSRCVCGIYDLANTFKFLQCSNSEIGGFWFAGGNCDCHSDYSLADLKLASVVDEAYVDGVGLLVL